MPWSKLIRPALLGVLAAAAEEDVSAQQSFASVSIDGGTVAIRNGLITDAETKEQHYLLDCDLFNEEQQTAQVTNVLRIAKSFNREAGRVFGWCIAELLHDALGPQKVPTRLKRCWIG